MQVVVISLAHRRPERLEAFRQRWAELDLDWPVTLVSATDGANLSRAVAEAACTDSHYRALQVSTGPVLVLEDDVSWTPRARDVLRALQPPARWDQLYLGGRILSPPRPIGDGLREVDLMTHTHAYLIRDPQRAALDLRPHLGGNIEVAYNALTHWRRLALTPFIAGQVAGPSDITGDRTRPLL